MKYLFYIGCSLALATPVTAQDAAVEEDGAGDRIVLIHPRRDTYITVVASGSPQGLDSAGQSISVVGSAEIAAVQGPDIARVLERLPGVSWTRNGPLGSATGVFVRGAPSEQLLVTVDGVRMADTASPSGGFDFGTLLPGGIAKLELLRGSNSVVWGSDALGGVLAVTSEAVNGARGSIEYGANDTLTATASAGLGGSAGSVTLNAGYARSDGVSAFDGGSEADGFRQWFLSGRGRFNAGEGLALVASGRYADSRVEFDGYPAPSYAFADTPEYQITRQGSGRIGAEYDADGVELRGGVALSDTRRAYFDPTYGAAPNFETAGRSIRADLSGHVPLGDRFGLDLGADSEWTRFSTTFDAQQDARLTSAHALLGYEGDGLHLSGGLRVDDHDRFGTHWTFGANGTVQLGDGWRLRASYGEGFKAPTLYQLYGYGGNTALQPETSRAFDGGVEWGDRNGQVHFAVTAFRRDAKNLIDYVWPAGYFNVGRTRAEGFEAELGGAITNSLRAGLAYTWLRATNRTTGKDLARRPRETLTATLDWTAPVAGLTLGADLRAVSASFDDAGNFTRIDPYTLVTLRAALPLGEQFELFGRVENVGDVHWATAAGYGAPGRSAYAGVRARW